MEKWGVFGTNPEDVELSGSGVASASAEPSDVTAGVQGSSRRTWDQDLYDQPCIKTILHDVLRACSSKTL